MILHEDNRENMVQMPNSLEQAILRSHMKTILKEEFPCEKNTCQCNQDAYSACQEVTVFHVIDGRPSLWGNHSLVISHVSYEWVKE